MNALVEQYKHQPFQILGFPCNQFFNQEPGDNATEIYGVLKNVRPGSGYVPKFQLFAKGKVNGAEENEIYTFLKGVCPTTTLAFSARKNLLYDPLSGDDIRWNFEKFLIGKDGKPYRRYDKALDPLEIRKDIEYLLGKKVDPDPEPEPAPYTPPEHVYAPDPDHVDVTEIAPVTLLPPVPGYGPDPDHIDLTYHMSANVPAAEPEPEPELDREFIPVHPPAPKWRVRNSNRAHWNEKTVEARNLLLEMMPRVFDGMING